jgi:hypothetical protein
LVWHRTLGGNWLLPRKHLVEFASNLGKDCPVTLVISSHSNQF